MPALREGGYEADHWSTLGTADAPDTLIMQYARARNYVVLTQDLDFSAILAATAGRKPSVIQVRAENLGAELVPIVLRALRQLEVELETGCLLTIEPARSRITMLPL